MPNEPMTLIERLRNPQWDPVGHYDSGATVLNVEMTLKTMKEAADKLERLGEQRVSKPSYAAKAGDWLDIGGGQGGGWGLGSIDVRISKGGDAWEWRSLTEKQTKWLVGLANTDPEGRDKI